mmetsp:Transcript_75684/g.213203  ORF Transcript_75684/g.213203 Transcript_75684/m.213203 type:complete len:226 (-) Transcript_75684:377-1054(-)
MTDASFRTAIRASPSIGTWLASSVKILLAALPMARIARAAFAGRVSTRLCRAQAHGVPSSTSRTFPTIGTRAAPWARSAAKPTGRVCSAGSAASSRTTARCPALHRPRSWCRRTSATSPRLRRNAPGLPSSGMRAALTAWKGAWLTASTSAAAGVGPVLMLTSSARTSCAPSLRRVWHTGTTGTRLAGTAPRTKCSDVRPMASTSSAVSAEVGRTRAWSALIGHS